MRRKLRRGPSSVQDRLHLRFSAGINHRILFVASNGSPVAGKIVAPERRYIRQPKTPGRAKLLNGFLKNPSREADSRSKRLCGRSTVICVVGTKPFSGLLIKGRAAGHLSHCVQQIWACGRAWRQGFQRECGGKIRGAALKADFQKLAVISSA